MTKLEVGTRVLSSVRPSVSSSADAFKRRRDGLPGNDFQTPSLHLMQNWPRLSLFLPLWVVLVITRMRFPSSTALLCGGVRLATFSGFRRVPRRVQEMLAAAASTAAADAAVTPAVLLNLC